MPLLKSKIAYKTSGFMLAGLLALLAIIGASIWLADRTQDHADEVVHARAIFGQATGVLSMLLDAETGQRGYLLTGDKDYLKPFLDAQAQLDGRFDRLKGLVADDPAMASSVARLASLAADKMGELSATIQLEENGSPGAALLMVRTDRGKEMMDQARGVLTQLFQQVNARITARLGDLGTATRTLTWTTLLGGALITLFAGGAFWTVSRYTGEILAARREVEMLNASLEQRVVERTAALQQANDEIQRFAYIVSHDLRSPLVNIMGFTAELEVGTEQLQKYLASEHPDERMRHAALVAADEDLPEAARFIRASTTKMDGLINAILKLSREGRRELRAEAIDLGKMVADAAASLQHQLDHAGARIEARGKYPVMISDRLALEQVMGNLLDNAVKYLSPERKGLITVEARESGTRVEITISDNGRGIAEQDHERIFELFRRAGAQDRPGEGIGLAHVRALVRRLGGDITVQSRLGAGSSFLLDLPRVLKISDNVPT